MNAHATDVQAVNAWLDQQPDDWEARLILADIHEERGEDDQARLQRWMATHQKRPEGPGTSASADGRDTRWWWWAKTFIFPENETIGFTLYETLPFASDHQDRFKRDVMNYPTRAEAEQALLASLKARDWPPPEEPLI